jgi:hypothetical protein
MAKTPLTIKRKKVIDLYCPECSAVIALRVPAQEPARYCVCQTCAAIGFWDAAKGCYQQPLTQEWLDVVTLPGFWDLLEHRQATLERITGPEPTNGK